MTHLSVSEEQRNGVSQRGKYREELLRSQQGELNAVLMYQRLAKVVKEPSVLLECKEGPFIEHEVDGILEIKK